MKKGILINAVGLGMVLGAGLIGLIAAPPPPAEPQTTGLIPYHDVFQTPAQAYALSHQPSLYNFPQVFVNGVLDLPGTVVNGVLIPPNADYTLIGQQLSFVVSIDPTDTTLVIQVFYLGQP
jgi:hypothetical protein